MNILQPTKVDTENGGSRHNMINMLHSGSLKWGFAKLRWLSPHKLMGTKISVGTKDLGFGTWSVHKVRNVKICQETIGCAKT